MALFASVEYSFSPILQGPLSPQTALQCQTQVVASSVAVDSAITNPLLDNDQAHLHPPDLPGPCGVAHVCTFLTLMIMNNRYFSCYLTSNQLLWSCCSTTSIYILN